jgi:Domain of unknown function (DUF4429)
MLNPMTVRLVGNDTTLEYDGQHCRLDYHDDDSAGWLRRRLGRLVVPVSALAGVELRSPRVLRPGRLRLIPRPGADPIAAVTDDSLELEQSPYVVEFASGQEQAARTLAARLGSAIAQTGLAEAAADEFLVAVPGPPISAQGSDGWLEFDGDQVRLWRDDGANPRARTYPVAAVESVSWVDGRGRQADYLRFDLVGDDPQGWRNPRGDPRCLRHSTVIEKAETLIAAAAVAVAVQRLLGSAHAPVAGPPHGLRVVPGGGTGEHPLILLHGVDGSAEFDGAEVTVRTPGAVRRIRLPAIERVELGTDRGTGYVRVHLAGAGSATPGGLDGLGDPDELGDAGFEPRLDADTVCHDSEPAALEFALRVTEALREVTRVPDARLLATAGPRTDLADALARAGPRARAMVPELAGLLVVLETDEHVRDLELAVSDRAYAGVDGGVAGLLALTDQRLLFLASGMRHGDPLSLGLRRIVTVRATWNDAGVGTLVCELRDGGRVGFDGVYHPVRFRELPRPAPVPEPEPDRRARIRLTNAPSLFGPPDYTGLRAVVTTAGHPDGSPPAADYAEGFPSQPDKADSPSVTRPARGEPAGQDDLRQDGGAPRRQEAPRVERTLLGGGGDSVPGTDDLRRADVADARRRAGTSLRRHRRELAEALFELAADERVYELAAAMLEGQSGLVVLTDRKLLFVSGGELLRIPLIMVRQVSAYDGLEELNLVANGTQFRFFRIQDAGRFGPAIKKLCAPAE